MAKIKIKKDNKRLSEENSELCKELDYITKEELIDAIKKIADEVGIEVAFTYENMKNDI